MRFLQSQAIPLSRVFDASGMSRSAYQAAMNELEMVVAIGVSPCKEAGHTLRTRAGHCAQCNTHALAFLLRHDAAGEVYVAVSAQSDLVKIGTSKNAQARMTSLNGFGYGGVTDWKVYCQYACNKAGMVEFLAQSTLHGHRTSRSYVKTGIPVDCQELFSCSASAAAAAVQAALKRVSKQRNAAMRQFSARNGAEGRPSAGETSVPPTPVA